MIDAMRNTAYICGYRGEDVEYAVHQALKRMGRYDLLPPCEQVRKRGSMTREELTRDIVGYEGIYTIDIFGNVIRVKDEKEIPQQKNKFGYMNVSLSKDGKQKQHKVHRLIAQAFIPNPLNKKQVNHIDGDKAHNVVWNLEWCTCKENINHAVKIGLNPKCTPVRVIGTGKTYPDITSCAKDINGDVGDIYRCLFGKRKTHKGFHFEKVV